MALNRIYKENERNNRARVVPAGTDSGDPLLIEGRPAVALTDITGSTKTFTDAGTGISVTIPSSGVGLGTGEASVAFDGTWEFSGVVSTGTTPVPTTTAQGTAVYFDDGDLTLVDTDNDLFGYVDYPVGYHKVAGTLPIRIGG